MSRIYREFSMSLENEDWLVIAGGGEEGELVACKVSVADLSEFLKSEWPDYRFRVVVSPKN